jgi:hypothetical protein
VGVATERHVTSPLPPALRSDAVDDGGAAGLLSTRLLLLSSICMIGKSTGATTGDASMTWAYAMSRVVVPVVGPILEGEAQVTAPLLTRIPGRTRGASRLSPVWTPVRITVTTAPLRASSSSWQSSGLLIRGLWVRAPRGPPTAWIAEYNTDRPHQALGRPTPAEVFTTRDPGHR